MAITFNAPANVGWLAERLRDVHGYLGPSDFIFYPTVEVEDGVLTIEARRPDGTDIDESDRADLQAIIDTHDGTPPPDEQSRQTEAEEARVRARDAIQTLEDAHANWDTLTQAQKDTALKLNTIVTAKLARLALRFFD